MDEIDKWTQSRSSDNSKSSSSSGLRRRAGGERSSSDEDPPSKSSSTDTFSRSSIEETPLPRIDSPIQHPSPNDPAFVVNKQTVSHVVFSGFPPEHANSYMPEEMNGESLESIVRDHVGEIWIFHPPKGIYRCCDVQSAVGFSGYQYRHISDEDIQKLAEKIEEVRQSSEKPPYHKDSRPLSLKESIHTFVSYRWQSGRVLIWSSLIWNWNSLPALITFVITCLTVTLSLSVIKEPCTKFCKIGTPDNCQEWDFDEISVPVWYCWDNVVRDGSIPGSFFFATWLVPLVVMLVFFWFRQVFYWRSRVFLDKLCVEEKTQYLINIKHKRTLPKISKCT